MSNEDEVKALKGELEQLRSAAEQGESADAQTANGERQREIISKLADLGVQLG